LIRTALTLSISTQDAQNTSYLANGTHLGLLSSAAQNIHVQTSHRPTQLIVALKSDDVTSGASIAQQRQLITTWQDFLQILAHHQGSELNGLMQKYHLAPEWLICLDQHRLQAWLAPDAGFYLLRGSELRRLRPVASRNPAAPATVEEQVDANPDARQFYALNIRPSDHFFLLPPALLSYFSPGEAADILRGLRQVPAKMGDLFYNARLRGYAEETTWLALQILRLEEDQLPDIINPRRRSAQQPGSLTGLVRKSRKQLPAELSPDSLGMDEQTGELTDLAGTGSLAAAGDRKMLYRLIGGLVALAFVITLIIIFWPGPKDPASTTTGATSSPTTRMTSAQPTLSPTPALTTTEALPRLTVNARQLNLREQPDRNAKLLTTLKNGDVLIQLAEPDGDWVKVETEDGLVGYVFNQYVTAAAP